MKSKTSSRPGSPLLDYAISKLNPEVFSHPVWVRFAEKSAPSSLELVGDLLSTVKSLQEEDPSTACQVLLICAVYQTRAGQLFNGLKTTQQALALAQSNHLSNEILWAMWGTCAIAIQQGNYDQATSSLVDLQTALSDQNDWILADFVDILRQSIPRATAIRAGNRSQTPHDGSFEGIVGFTVDWFQHWGFAIQLTGSESGIASLRPVEQRVEQPAPSRPFLPDQHTQGRWHNLMLGIRGEFRFQWTKSNSPAAERKHPFWRALLSTLRSYFFRRKTGAGFVEEVPQVASTYLLPAPATVPLSKAPKQRKRPAPTKRKVREKKRSEPGLNTVPVAVHMLGAFSVSIGDLAVKLPASRGLSMFKYLLLHHKQRVPREIFMDTFWPDVEPETARNNLNVAIHSLRKALRAVVFLPVILFEDGAYGLEPNLQVWLDVEEFERCAKAGQQFESRDQLRAAVAEYETAVSLYQGDFLEQNPYDEWTVLDRERLRIAYLDTLDRLSHVYFHQERYAACIRVCQLIVARDRCREDAHCLLMRSYSRQGQYHLAFRQYQICVEALRLELDVEPAPETTQLYEAIRRRDNI